MSETQKTRFNVSGDELVDAVKKLIHEGNIRRVRLLQGEKPLIDIPLTIGASAAVITVLAAPVLAAVAVIAALVSECTIEVEKVGGQKGEGGRETNSPLGPLLDSCKKIKNLLDFPEERVYSLENLVLLAGQGQDPSY